MRWHFQSHSGSRIPSASTWSSSDSAGHRLMREHEATLEEHLGEVAQAQLVAQAPEHDQ